MGFKQIILNVLASALTATILFGILNDQSKTVQTDDSVLPTGNQNDVTEIVEDVLPAVVSIIVSADVPIYERRLRSFPGFFGQEIVIPRSVQIGTERVEVGGGSGFIVSNSGFIMTNNHVVNRRNVDYSVVLDDGQIFDARIVARFPELDIAVIKIGTIENQFSSLEFGDSDTLRLGETAIAIGNALAEFPNSVSVGVISGLARDITATDNRGRAEMLEGLIQTDAAINQGNSGGPLLNSAGQVVGMNVAVADGTENIGFAIPSNLVRDVLEQVLLAN